jgi:Phage integrase family.
MAYAEKRGKTWRVKYKRPDGSEGSESGFPTKSAALAFGREQESRIRRNEWIDPKGGRMRFAEFTTAWIAAARLSANTRAKYESFLRTRILPEWGDWQLGALVGAHLEISGWVTDLHEELAESSVASIFACFSTIMNAAVDAQRIPASPCARIRVTSGGYETEHLVATPVQVLRAAMRLHQLGSHSDFVLCLMASYTGARWGELAGQTRAEYDRVNRAIRIIEPLTETAGVLAKGGRDVSEVPTEGRRRRARTKTPAGTRWVQLPPFLAALYEALMASHESRYVFVGRRGGLLRRGNYRRRLWRPAWDGDPANPDPARRVPPILRGFRFHETRHTHRTWLAADGVPEVARAARLGHQLQGMANVYEHVTPEMEEQVLACLTRRWQASIRELHPAERDLLLELVPSLRLEVEAALAAGLGDDGAKVISQIPPRRRAR